MAYDPSNPNKYKNQASQYNGSVSSVKGELEVALSELNRVNETLGFSNSESSGIATTGPGYCNDILTYNVIVSNEEIKTEIKNIDSDLGMYSSLISKKASELDKEEKEEYDRMMALLKAKELEKQEEEKAKENN